MKKAFKILKNNRIKFPQLMNFKKMKLKKNNWKKLRRIFKLKLVKIMMIKVIKTYYT